MTDSPRANDDATPLVKPLLRGWLHLVGVVILLAATPLLVARARTDAQVAWIACYVVGVATMMATSAVFHRVQWSPGPRRRMRRADHATIFLAIAGSWLAIAGLTMHGTIRAVLLSIIALGTVVGITVRQLALDTPKWVNTLPYLVVGWAAVGVLPQIYRGAGPVAFWLILAGGVAYSFGAAAYGAKRPRLNPRVFGYHEFFHAATLLGAACHFVALYLILR